MQPEIRGYVLKGSSQVRVGGDSSAQGVVILVPGDALKQQ